MGQGNGQNESKSMMREKKLVFTITVVSVLVALLFSYPRYTEKDDLKLLTEYRWIQEDLLPVMTFNIRFDGVERDPNNHFTKRISRLTETITRWQPAILGVQEPFTGQLAHWQSTLPASYRSIGYQRSPSSQRDFQVAILYDEQRLKLIERDYLWLSKSPRVEESKDWESSGARTLNIARFQWIRNDSRTKILVFNTHLDVKGERARREQAKIVRSTMEQWQRKYPTDAVLLLGDFNTLPQQTVYHILTANEFLHDAWAECKVQLSTCQSNVFSSTFHGWLGSLINTYAAQLVQAVLYTFHASGVTLPYEIPTTLSSYWKVFRDLGRSFRLLHWSEIWSLWSSHRFHVDWILYQRLQPRFVAVVDVRSGNYSSDHFPLLALFQVDSVLTRHDN